MAELSPKDRQKLLDAFADGDSVSEAAVKLDRSRGWIYKLWSRNPKFKAECTAVRQNQPKKNTGSRPGKIPAVDDEVKAKVLEAFERGCDHGKACQAGKISKPTLYIWWDKDPEFKHACHDAIELADGEMVNSLYAEGTRGHSIKHMCPSCDFESEVKLKGGNLGAIIFWLKNRRPKEWRDKPELAEQMVPLAALDELLEKVVNAVNTLVEKREIRRKIVDEICSTLDEEDAQPRH